MALPHSSRFLILLGGDLSVTPALETFARTARVIAADGGIAHARALDVTPELWIGDFDSATSEDQTLFSAVPRAEFPADKAKTDGELAVEAAIDRGARAMTLAGAFGGARFDHGFLHLVLAVRLAEGGIETRLTSGREEAVPLATGRDIAFDWPDGTRFSILALEDLKGLTVSGARWPLVQADIPFGSSRILSNLVSGQLSVRLEEGRALALATLGIETR